jgi:hypothetical protein
VTQKRFPLFISLKTIKGDVNRTSLDVSEHSSELLDRIQKDSSENGGETLVSESDNLVEDKPSPLSSGDGINTLMKEFINKVSSYHALIAITGMMRPVLHESLLDNSISKTAKKEYAVIDESDGHTIWPI